jgi:RNA polymerase sigma-70 factor (ECF subfamily)
MVPAEHISESFPHAGWSGDRAALDRALEELLEKARTAWPTIKVDRAAFLAHVAERMPAEGTADAAVGSLHAGDLFLAFGCAVGEPHAITAFEQHFLPEVAGYVAQIDRSGAFVDEVRQRLRERLLVSDGEGGKPKISEYTGRGPLAAWLRVASVRTALNLRRGAKREVSTTEETPAMRAPAVDPELDYLKTRYAQEFKEVFKATLGTLNRDERTVLRLHYMDGLTLDQIAVAYHVHRSTAARWLASARERIVTETKRLLSERLKANPKEVESLLAVVRSQLDVSIYKYLGKDEG